MKKLIILIGAILLSGATFGQKATLDNPWSVEGAVAFGGTNGVTWTAPSIRARYFVKDNIAVRASLGLGDGLGTPRSEKNTFYENADGTGNTGFSDISNLSWNAQIGGEYHLKGTDRMSPYFMLGVNFGSGSSIVTTTDSDGDIYVAGLNTKQTGGFVMFGVQLGAGMDYYIAENIYIGLELGLSYNSISNDAKVFKANETMVGFEPETSESYLTTAAGNTALRLGWRF